MVCQSLILSLEQIHQEEVTNRMEYTEKLIIEQLKSGNEKAYKYLYDQHYSMLCHVANGYLHDALLAESIVGDVIFHIWEIRETLEISTTLRGYLMRSVRNRCINHIHSKQERVEVSFSNLSSEEPMQLVISDSYPLGQLLERELEEKIQEAIGGLSGECRVVFMKSRFEEMKYDEIAQDLGISVNTVKYHIKNALSSIRGDLEKYLILLLLLFQ